MFDPISNAEVTLPLHLCKTGINICIFFLQSE